jgi:hypothetical protein
LVEMPPNTPKKDASASTGGSSRTQAATFPASVVGGLQWKCAEKQHKCDDAAKPAHAIEATAACANYSVSHLTGNRVIQERHPRDTSCFA